MDLRKSEDFFNPESLGTSRVHIIGCGSVGSTLAELLARFGIKNFSLYDFDKVESKNIVNQMFFFKDVGRLKTEAVEETLKAINPDVDIRRFDDGYNGQKLSGYVFLCVDSIELRKKIAESNTNNNFIKAMFDFRTGLTDAQHYAADWSNTEQKKNFIASMSFTDKEANDATPKSACGITLGVAPTVRAVCNIGATNFINFMKSGSVKQGIVIDAFAPTLFEI